MSLPTLKGPGATLFLAALFWAGTAANAAAQPPGAVTFCDVYSDAPACLQGITQCTTCHSVPPAHNLYGAQVADVLLPDAPRPLSDEDYERGLPAALAQVADLDADGDGFSNLTELLAGADPALPSDVPLSTDSECNDYDVRPSGLDVCGYDPVYVFKKIRLDFCGVAPSYDEMKEFEENGTTDALTAVLDDCLDTEYWRGKDGVVWNLANSKIKPIQAIKGGEDQGPIPLGDYYDDYNFYVYVNSDDRDAREVLTGNYFVERTENPTTYSTFDRNGGEDLRERGYERAQAVTKRWRAGMLTHRWFLMSNTMFTSLPRTTAAQAYRAYLGLDISRLEGLQDVPGEPQDFDNKGVRREECAVCHATLDPLTYPFSRYEGIGGGEGEILRDWIPFTYAPNRLLRFTQVDGASVKDTPEAGWIFGQQVSTLPEWAEVAANSDQFAQALVADFWELLLGEEPQPNELVQFEELWRGFMTDHEYRTEKMLHDLVLTEAYGVP